MSPLPTLILRTLSTATALVAAGGIATLSAFDLPILRAQPASRSLPSTRWLFSRGSHVFPTASVASTAGFCALAFLSLGPARGVGQVVRLVVSGRSAKLSGYVMGAALSASIGPFTGFVMVPINFEIIELNRSLGGKRSADATDAAAGSGQGRWGFC